MRSSSQIEGPLVCSTVSMPGFGISWGKGSGAVDRAHHPPPKKNQAPVLVEVYRPHGLLGSCGTTASRWLLEQKTSQPLPHLRATECGRWRRRRHIHVLASRSSLRVIIGPESPDFQYLWRFGTGEGPCQRTGLTSATRTNTYTYSHTQRFTDVYFCTCLRMFSSFGDSAVARRMEL